MCFDKYFFLARSNFQKWLIYFVLNAYNALISNEKYPISKSAQEFGAPKMNSNTNRWKSNLNTLNKKLKKKRFITKEKKTARPDNKVKNVSSGASVRE